MKIGSTEFDFRKKIYVMGILNVTPDSFSDGGEYLDPSRAVDRAVQMQEEGADLIDLGAESSRPGSKSVPSDEEQRRLLPVLKRLVGRLKIPISVDTRKAVIAEEALREGAALINDISAFRHDFRMAEVVAQHGVPCILMHMRGEPETMQNDIRYLNAVAEIIHFLKGQIDLATRLGVSRSRILVDPGIGFGKETGHNLEILKKLSDLSVLESPIVVGTSRKRFIREVLDVGDPRVPSVENGSLATAVVAAWNGASIIRTHQVVPTAQAIRIVQSIRSHGQGDLNFGS